MSGARMRWPGVHLNKFPNRASRHPGAKVIEKGRQKPPFPSVLTLPLSVDFDAYTRAAHFVAMIVAVAFVHVETRSTASYALALAKAFVAHFAAHPISLSGDG
jgi:hypothetical protein